jgi:glutamyl/glutaminyl-tRNA synthetase
MYTKTIELDHNEIPAKINVQTGEIKELNHFNKKKLKDNTMQYFNHDQPYTRTFTRAWLLLKTQTTDVEFKAANTMALLARAYTNSLEPLTPESTMLSVAETLNIDRRYVSSIIDKLYKLGVIAKFEVYNRNEVYQNYWVFNPYLAFNGKTIKREVATLFDKTFYATM